MVSGLKTMLFFLGFFVLCPVMFSRADPMLCSRVYKYSGGPVAMSHIPGCSLRSIDRETVKTSCQARSVAGQDLFLCALHITTPALPADKGIEQVEIIGSAVFSRNNSTDAVDKACHLEALMRYFSLHTQLLAQEMQLSGKVGFDDSFRLMLLKEALIRTAKDANEIFSSDVHLKELASDSTATITLSIHGNILVANIGHPKTAVWSMKLRPWGEHESSSFGRYFSEVRKGNMSATWIQGIHFVESRGHKIGVTDVLESNDCDPDRRNWIEYAFRLIVDSIAIPTDQFINSLSERYYSIKDFSKMSQENNTSALIQQYVASRPLGAFQVVEKMNLTDVLWEEGAGINPNNSTAELLVGTVITRDDMGNLAAVVVPLQN